MHLIIGEKQKIYTPSIREIRLSKDEETVSRTDIYGNIIYYNHTFSKISGYSKNELLRTPHSVLIHPDMPKAIFYFIWKTLLAGNSTCAIIKNLSKSGAFYWQFIEFKVQKNSQNNTVSFLSKGVQASLESIRIVEPLYQRLLRDEREYDTKSSIQYLADFLKGNNIATFNDYIIRVSKKRKQSIFSSLNF
jgi:PAS domain S-box-containing protein